MPGGETGDAGQKRYFNILRAETNRVSEHLVAPVIHE